MPSAAANNVDIAWQQMSELIDNINIHSVRIKTGPLIFFIIQQNRLNFKHTNNRANQQEKAILIETYKTLPVL